MSSLAPENFADRLVAAIGEKKRRSWSASTRFTKVFLPPSRSIATSTIMRTSKPPSMPFSNSARARLKIVAPHVAAVKINSAFFEQYYWYGCEAFAAVVQEAAAHGLIVINDAKRADIGNTSERYAAATLADPQFSSLDDTVGADAVTVNPYMGHDSVGPFIKVAQEFDKGVFVLVRTSNPGAAEIQDMLLQDGTPLYQHVGKLVAKWGEPLIGKRGYSSVGAVVGATNPQQLAALRDLLPHTFFLVPGYGAQGASAADITKAFKPDGTGAIIASSRSIIFAHKDKKYAGLDWEKATEAAVLAAKSEISEAIKA